MAAYWKLVRGVCVGVVGIASVSTCGAETLVTLEALVSKAIETHPTVLGREAERQSADEGVGAAKWRFGPSFSANNDSSSGGSTRTVAIQQPLWTGGALTAGLDHAQAQLDRAKLAREESREQVAEKVIDAYGDWLRAHGKTQGIQRVGLAYRRFLDQIERRERLGAASRADIELVRSRLLQAATDSATVQAAERIAVGQIEQLVGSALTSELLAIEEAKDDQLPSLDEMLFLTKVRSPALGRSRAQVVVASAEIDAKRAAALPQVSLAWERNYGSATGIDYSSSGRTSVRVQFAPGAGLSAVSDINAAEARHRAAQSDTEALERDVVTKLSAAFTQYRSLQESKAGTMDTWVASRSILQSYERQFLAGKRSWLDVMNAVRELDQVERALADLDGNMVVLERRVRLLAYGLQPGRAP